MSTEQELAAKIDLHLSLDNAATFVLTQDDFRVISKCLKRLAPDKERATLDGLNALRRQYPRDLAFANTGFTMGVVRAVVDAVLK